MQSDPPDHGVPASSPTISSMRPTPTPTQTAGLRRRGISQSPPRSRATGTIDHDVISLQISTPYADLGQAGPRTWNVPPNLTVREVKDAIASGAAGYGQWERVGLRLVWRGRMLRDEDVLRAVFATETRPTLHLVARLITPSVTASASEIQQPVIPTGPTTTAAVALTDCVHYVLFTMREHLCHLLGTPVLQWEDMYPKPTLPRETARVAVMSVVKDTQTAVDWEGAFDLDLAALWARSGRAGVEEQVRSFWSAATGWEYSSSGESAPVELDSATYNLILPPLADMAPSQMVHLLLYLRNNALLPGLYSHLATANTPPSPSPTPTPTTAPTGLPPRGMQVYRTPMMRIPHIPFAWAQHQLFSAMRMATVIYMLVGGIPIWDPRIWMIGGAAFAWWVIDGAAQWRVIGARQQAAQANGVPQAQAEEENPLDPALMAAGQPREPVQNAPPRNLPAGNGPPQMRNMNLPNNVDWLKLIPLWNLDHDAMYLRLPRQGTEPAPIPATRPNFYHCRMLLPVYLWLVTLVPAFEANRHRAIRQRERTMRSMVTALTPQTDGAERVLPDGLLSQVKAYYLRVVSRDEQIDWEEERDAQRAMGIRDEEAVPLL